MGVLGLRLRKLRAEKELTLREAGAALGISHGTLAGYESSRRSPDPETLLALADFFNVSIDYLTGKSDIREKPEDIIKQFLSPEEYEEQAKGKIVAKNFAEMDEEDQKRLLDYMEVLMRGKK